MYLPEFPFLEREVPIVATLACTFLLLLILFLAGLVADLRAGRSSVVIGPAPSAGAVY